MTTARVSAISSEGMALSTAEENLSLILAGRKRRGGEVQDRMSRLELYLKKQV